MTNTIGMHMITSEIVTTVTQPGKQVTLYSHAQKVMSEMFLKGEPKILGAIQVLVALMILSLGILMMCTSRHTYLPLSVVSGYTVWGSIMFIVSGSLSIGAGSRTIRCLIKGSLGVNVASAIFAVCGIIICSISLTLHERFSCRSDFNRADCPTRALYVGLESLLFISSVLEFCAAVSVSAFGCKVTCCAPEEMATDVMFLVPSNVHVAETASPAFQ